MERENFKKNSGQVDLGNIGQRSSGKLKPTVRTGEKQMTGLETQQSWGLKHHQQLENFSLRPSVNCDCRTWVLPVASKLFSLTGWTLLIEQPHLALIPRGYLIHKDSLLGCAYSTAGKDIVCGQGERILCTLDASGKPMVIESRKSQL